jgi:hypothetical protein
MAPALGAEPQPGAAWIDDGDWWLAAASTESRSNRKRHASPARKLYAAHAGSGRRSALRVRDVFQLPFAADAFYSSVQSRGQRQRLLYVQQSAGNGRLVQQSDRRLRESAVTELRSRGVRPQPRVFCQLPLEHSEAECGLALPPGALDRGQLGAFGRDPYDDRWEVHAHLSTDQFATHADRVFVGSGAAASIGSGGAHYNVLRSCAAADGSESGAADRQPGEEHLHGPGGSTTGIFRCTRICVFEKGGLADNFASRLTTRSTILSSRQWIRCSSSIRLDPPHLNYRRCGATNVTAASCASAVNFSTAILPTSTLPDCGFSTTSNPSC